MTESVNDRRISRAVRVLIRRCVWPALHIQPCLLRGLIGPCAAQRPVQPALPILLPRIFAWSPARCRDPESEREMRFPY